MEDNQQEWEIVNNKQRKQQKQSKAKEKRTTDKLKKDMELAEEEARKKKEKDKFYEQYVQAKIVNENVVIASTVFETFNVEEARKKKKEDDQKISDWEYKHPGQSYGEKLKIKAQKTKVKKVTLSQASAQIDNKSLKDLISQYSQRYPNNYDVQLKSLAEHFENVFKDTQKEEQKAREDKPFERKMDMPYSYLQSGATDSVRNWMEKMPEESIVVFFWFLVTTLILIAEKKHSTGVPKTSGVGLKILIQIIARNFPNAITSNIPKIKQQYCITQPSNDAATLQPAVAPTFLWIFAQTLEMHISVALSLWFQFLLPLMPDETKTAAKLRENCLQYILHAVNAKKKEYPDEASALIGFERMVWMKASDKLVGNEFKDLLPQLMSPVFLFPPGGISSKYFTLLLGHSATSKEGLRDELLGSLVWCLENDLKCFNYWHGLYSRFIAQSNNLMVYMLLNWNNIAGRISPDNLLDVVKSFSKANKQLLQGTYIEHKGAKQRKATTVQEVKEINMCMVTCKALVKNLRPLQRKYSNGNSMLTTIWPISAVLVAGAYYTASNCCQLDWCSSVSIMNELLHCH